MIIEGRSGKYKVIWGKSGYSFAVPFVYVKKWWGWKEVGEGNAIGYLEAEEMYPKTMKKWFISAVKKYEDYKQAWESE